MEQFIAKLVIIFLGIIGVYGAKKNIKDAKSFIEKILYLLSYFIYLVPITIYILDSYNIPTKINVFNSVDSERWNEFLISYVNTIAGNIVSGVILLLITFWQIRKQNENNNDDKRIQNAPIIKYDISNEYIDESIELFLFNNKVLKTEPYHLFLDIENIGLNHAKNFQLDILDNKNKLIRTYMIDNNQSILKKDQKIGIDIIINLTKDKKQEILKIIVYYDDLLKNIYRQDIEISISPTKEYSTKYKGKKLYINNIYIKDELLIKEGNNERNGIN